MTLPDLTPEAVAENCPLRIRQPEEVVTKILKGRLWERVHFRGEDECWDRQQITSRGYGAINFRGLSYRAHRLAYVARNGPIPNGLMIDHICRNRRCCNPSHLRAVDARVNSLENSIGPTAVNAQKTHCAHGHPFTSENTYLARGRRYCLECKRRLNRVHNRKRRAKAILAGDAK